MRNYKSKKFIEYNTIEEYHGITEYPQLVVPKKFLDRFEASNWQSHFKSHERNKILWIVSTIYLLKQQGGKKYDDPLSYVNVSADILDEVISTGYAGYKEFLLDHDLIQIDGICYPQTDWRKGKCYGFRLHPEIADGACETIRILGPNKFYDRALKALQAGKALNESTPSHDHILENTLKLQIPNVDGLLYYLYYELEKSDAALTMQKAFVHTLGYENRPFFTIDKPGRIYSTFTNLFKEARPELRLDGKPLVGVDISGSHFFHALMLFPDRDSPKTKKLRNLILKGNLYEELLNCYEIHWNNTRDDLKLYALQFLHSHPERMNAQARQVGNAIRTLCPDFWEWMYCEKFPEDDPFVSFKDFSNMLFKEEADRVIVDSVGALMDIDSDFPVLSLHDALFPTEDKPQEVLKVMKEVYGDTYGYVPPMKIEVPDKIEEPTDFSFLDEGDDLAEDAVA